MHYLLKGDEQMPITLKAARVNANMTQKQVAEALKINRNTVASYEAYKTKPDIETSARLADLYGLSVDDIIFFKTHCA